MGVVQTTCRGGHWNRSGCWPIIAFFNRLGQLLRFGLCRQSTCLTGKERKWHSNICTKLELAMSQLSTAFRKCIWKVLDEENWRSHPQRSIFRFTWSRKAYVCVVNPPAQLNGQDGMHLRPESPAPACASYLTISHTHCTDRLLTDSSQGCTHQRRPPRALPFDNQESWAVSSTLFIPM